MISANPGSNDGSYKQINKAFLNQNGNILGNGNGSIFVTINSVNFHHEELYGTATRRTRCTQCGKPILVPLEANTIMCSDCQDFSPVPLQPNNRFANNAPPFIYERPDQFYFPLPQPLRAPPPPLTPPSAYGNKRAVLCGISYVKRVDNRFDVRCMKNFLIDNMGFPRDSIRMLTDDPEERNPLQIPTKYNLRIAMRWLVEGCQPGDSLVFYYSGHGCEEALYPVDYEHEGKILDDEINATIVRPLPRGAKLHAIVDTCFSGIFLDLPFICRMNSWTGYYGWEDHKHPRAGNKGTRGGLVVCISASNHNGNPANTSALGGMDSAGAFAFNFVEAMRNEPELTYGRLLNAMHSAIGGFKARTFGLFGQGHAMDTWQQHINVPQLSSSEKFDIYSKLIVM